MSLDILTKFAAVYGLSTPKEAYEKLRSLGMTDDGFRKLGFDGAENGPITTMGDGPAIGNGMTADSQEAIERDMQKAQKVAGELPIGEAEHWLTKGIKDNVPKALVGLGGLGALGAITEHQRLKQKAKMDEAKGEHLDDMLAKNPDLVKHPKPEAVKEYFDVLHNFAPDIAAHPHAAGAWVRSQIRYSEEGVPFGAVQDLITAQKAHDTTQHRTMNRSVLERLATGTTLQQAK